MKDRSGNGFAVRLIHFRFHRRYSNKALLAELTVSYCAVSSLPEISKENRELASTEDVRDGVGHAFADLMQHKISYNK